MSKKEIVLYLILFAIALILLSMSGYEDCLEDLGYDKGTAPDSIKYHCTD